MFPNPQDALPIPQRPDLGQYRKLAKELVKAARGGGREAIAAWVSGMLPALIRSAHVKLEPQMPVAVERWGSQLEEFAARRLLEEGSGASLTDAQFVLARAHGFASWPRMVRHFEKLAQRDSEEARFEAAADAIVQGDAATLEGLLREDPALVRARCAREHRATLLHYVSANGVEGYRQTTPPNVVAIARLLLDAGSAVDAECDVYGGGATTLGLTATSVHPEAAGVMEDLLALLLERGAAIEHPRSGGNDSSAVRACLDNGRPQAARFLADRGARLDVATAAGIGRMEALAGFFADGAAPVSQAQLNSALRYASWYGQREASEFLLAHGAKPGEG